jgi:EAL domain-containing protein (putative c-di-GMP-specific phosphodiesterase class I)
MPPETATTGCHACKDGVEAPFPFAMAFQPIVDVAAGKIYAYEALVRGPGGESAASVLAQLTDSNRYAFDQSCRVRAIELASRLGLADTGARLSINFMPGAVYSPAACIRLTLETAARCRFPPEQLIFEITEAENVHDRAHLLGIVDEYRRRGFSVALDDLGAGYSGLNLLADLAPDIVKLDMELTRDIDRRPAAQEIVDSMVQLAETLRFALVAEGIETLEEFHHLRGRGVRLMQGYLLAKPAFEALPPFSIPETPRSMPASRGQARNHASAQRPSPKIPAEQRPKKFTIVE